MNVLITGTSSGIGLALAEHYLTNHWVVYGISRRPTEILENHPRSRQIQCDLTDAASVSSKLQELLDGAPVLDLVVLNAGMLGRIADMSEVTIDELKQTMDINCWASKSVIDALYEIPVSIKQVVAISSGAAVNGNRGWNGYAISKAAANMLLQLYAHEHPETHFCAIAPGLVDTAMQEFLCDLPDDERFTSLQSIKSKRHSVEMPQPNALAPRLADIFQRAPDQIESGQFADIRNSPLSVANA